MSDIIVLDTGVLGMLVHPAKSGEPWECKTWLRRVVLRGASVYVPEIADYEKALDADAILAAQSTLLSQSNDQVIVATTTNVGHLSRFVNARPWRDIP